MYQPKIHYLIRKGLPTSAALAVLSMVFAAHPATACTVSSGAKPQVASPLSAAAPVTALAHDDKSATRSSSWNTKGFVGLWDSRLIYQGQVVDEGFDAFHSDGTEILIDQSAPATDNVCLGVWEENGPSTIELKHPSWYFDLNGNLLGVVVIHERLTLDPDGDNFHGTASEDIYDIHGNKIAHDEGYQIKATRITPH